MYVDQGRCAVMVAYAPDAEADWLIDLQVKAYTLAIIAALTVIFANVLSLIRHVGSRP